MFIPQKIFGILGCPLGHSLSPALHNWGFQGQGYPGAYFVFEKRTDELESFMVLVRSLPVQGLSVTIPHKEAVIPFLDRISPEARQAGAVNTVYWQDGQLCGENTDVRGFCAPLLELRAAEKAVGLSGCPEHDSIGRALILGAGGAARAAIIGLRKLGCKNIFITARRSEQSAGLAAEFGIQAVSWEERGELPIELLINSTPLGLKGEQANFSPYPEEAFAGQVNKAALTDAASGDAHPGYLPCDQENLDNRKNGQKGKAPLAYDLIYTPAETLFLKQAKAQGWNTLNGFDMFVGQGLAQFKLWTGLDLPVREAAALLEQQLADRQR